MMTSKDVVDLYRAFRDAGIEIWVDGGWSVDALLGRQLRPHNDLDIAIAWKDVQELRRLMEERGYRQVRDEGQWNFVLGNGDGHELDVHAFVLGESGIIVDGIMYPPGSLTGEGVIEGVRVRCIDARHMVAFLAPYVSRWPEKYAQAILALCDHFGFELPVEYLQYQRDVRTT